MTPISTALMITLALTLTACSGGGESLAPALSPTATTASPFTLASTTLGGQPGFVNAAGMAVYVFDGDLQQASTSACGSICIELWPALSPPPNTLVSGAWSTFTRQDGSQQLRYKNHPLYTYANDTPGAARGDNIYSFGSLWHTARP